ncbi:hypothetical protein H8959_015300 [Pygathrix nigripes]
MRPPRAGGGKNGGPRWGRGSFGAFRRAAPTTQFIRKRVLRGSRRMVLSPQPPRRSPLGSGDTEPESERMEGDHRRDREDEVLAWALQPGKKLGVGRDNLLSCAKWRIQKYSAFISIKFASNLHGTHLIAETSTLLAL